MDHHFVWLIWASAFMVPWMALFVANPRSLFELARHTGFDIESLIFAFALGGIGSVLYNTIAHEPPPRRDCLRRERAPYREARHVAPERVWRRSRRHGRERRSERDRSRPHGGTLVIARPQKLTP